ncbi:transposase [Devosia sp. Leaf420]|uniref:transposase n=1 Tax=Devosia sp. Leaf420 TaxID=1736374 RepID=UPI0009E7AA0E
MDPPTGDGGTRNPDRHLRPYRAAHQPHRCLRQPDRRADRGGIGLVTATTLLAFLPEAGHRSPKTIAALAGLAPFNNDSGLFRGKRSIRGGRPRVRSPFVGMSR